MITVQPVIEHIKIVTAWLWLLFSMFFVFPFLLKSAKRLSTWRQHEFLKCFLAPLCAYLGSSWHSCSASCTHLGASSQPLWGTFSFKTSQFAAEILQKNSLGSFWRLSWLILVLLIAILSIMIAILAPTWPNIAPRWAKDTQLDANIAPKTPNNISQNL